MNHPRIVAVCPLGDYRLELQFTDGSRGEVDLHDDVVGKGGVFAQLESPDFFRKVRVDSEVGTLIWPNDVDLCPDVLHDRVLRGSRVKTAAKMGENAGAA